MVKTNLPIFCSCSNFFVTPHLHLLLPHAAGDGDSEDDSHDNDDDGDDDGNEDEDDDGDVDDDKTKMVFPWLSLLVPPHLHLLLCSSQSPPLPFSERAFPHFILIFSWLEKHNF